MCHQTMDHSITLARVADLEVGRWASAVNGFYVLGPPAPLHAVLYFPAHSVCVPSPSEVSMKHEANSQPKGRQELVRGCVVRQSESSLTFAISEFTVSAVGLNLEID